MKLKWLAFVLVLAAIVSGCEFLPGSSGERVPIIQDLPPIEPAPAEDSAEEDAGDADTSEEELADPDTADKETADTVSITTSDGCVITFFGPFEARRGDPFIVEFRVVCNGNPGQGTFFATLGVPPSDANATHANGELGADGHISLTLEVNWETGETTLLCSYNGEVYEVTEITILEAG